MKTKLTSFFWCAVLTFVLPLVGQQHLLWTGNLGVLALTMALLIGTQPPVRFAESRTARPADRLSTEVIAGCYVFCQAVSVVEWRWYRVEHHVFVFDPVMLTGLLLLIGGLVFRVWSIHLLGLFFTASVRTQTNQRIITAGAYRIIRHPSYLGAYIVMIASSIILHAYVGMVVSAVVMFAAYWYRIRVEEVALIKAFGQEYAHYQRKSKKLIPFVY